MFSGKIEKKGLEFGKGEREHFRQAAEAKRYLVSVAARALPCISLAHMLKRCCLSVM